MQSLALTVPSAARPPITPRFTPSSFPTMCEDNATLEGMAWSERLLASARPAVNDCARFASNLEAA